MSILNSDNAGDDLNSQSTGSKQHLKTLREI